MEILTVLGEVGFRAGELSADSRRLFYCQNDNGVFRDVTKELSPNLQKKQASSVPPYDDYKSRRWFDLVVSRPNLCPLLGYQNQNGKIGKG